MLESISGIVGNFTCIILWLPAAILVWKNRNDQHALISVSLTMQILAIINTLSRCLNGLSTHKYNLAFGTIIKTMGDI